MEAMLMAPAVKQQTRNKSTATDDMNVVQQAQRQNLNATRSFYLKKIKDMEQQHQQEIKALKVKARNLTTNMRMMSPKNESGNNSSQNKPSAIKDVAHFGSSPRFASPPVTRPRPEYQGGCANSKEEADSSSSKRVMMQDKDRKKFDTLKTKYDRVLQEKKDIVQELEDLKTAESASSRKIETVRDNTTTSTVARLRQELEKSKQENAKLRANVESLSDSPQEIAINVAQRDALDAIGHKITELEAKFNDDSSISSRNKHKQRKLQMQSVVLEIKKNIQHQNQRLQLLHKQELDEKDDEMLEWQLRTQSFYDV
jgi:hypothetical protein